MRLSDVEGIPDTTSCVFYLRVNVLAGGSFHLVDIQSGKRHRDRDEHAVYGKVHTRTDPPTITKRVYEWIAEFLCPFVLCGLHKAVGVERKAVGI